MLNFRPAFYKTLVVWSSKLSRGPVPRRQAFGFGSNDPAIGAQHLAVDPSAIETREERDRVGDVPGLSQTLQRSESGKMIDEFRRFAGPRDAGSNGVERWRGNPCPVAFPGLSGSMTPS